MKFKKLILNLESEIDLKTWSSLNKSHNSYNDIKFYLLHDEENPKIKYVIYMFNEDSKIIKDKKDKTMKQSEFQQTVLMAIDKINIKIDKMDTEFQDFKNYVIEKFDEQDKTNKLILNKLDNFEKYVKEEFEDIKYRLTRLESFHEEDIKNYELANKDSFKKNTN